MIIVLVRWQIKKGRRREFLKEWEQMLTPRDHSGLYREILAGPEERAGDEYKTFDLISSSYETFVNVGIWESIAAFERAVGTFMHRRKAGFEFKLRERIVLTPVSDRSGHYELPPPRIDGGRTRRAGGAPKSRARAGARR